MNADQVLRTLLESEKNAKEDLKAVTQKFEEQYNDLWKKLQSEKDEKLALVSIQAKEMEKAAQAKAAEEMASAVNKINILKSKLEKMWDEREEFINTILNKFLDDGK
jgi:flagellar motor protein MotB